MNNTKVFIRNFSSDDLPSTIIKYFDEIMVLYNIVGDIQDLDICVDNDSSVAIFTLLTEYEKDAKNLYDSLNQSSFSVYNTKYNIDMELNKTSIKTIISKATS